MFGNTEGLWVCGKEIGLEGNVDKTRNMFMSHEQNAGQNHNIKISFKAVVKFRYLGITLTDLMCIHRENQNRLNCGMSATVGSGMFCPIFCCPKM